jgi:hypothetical protein
MEKLEKHLIKTSLKVAAQLDGKDNKAILRTYRSINNLLFRMIDEMRKLRIPIVQWQEYFEIHLTKFAVMNASLIKEFEGVSFKLVKGSKTPKIHNISAIFLLNRSQMETFFIIKYLYFNAKTEDQGAFRNLLYKYSGISQRQKFPANLEKNKKTKEEEGLIAVQLKTEIENNTYFKTLPKEVKNHFMSKCLAKEIGWPKIIDECGINKNYYHQYWEYLSNYAHSEQIEAMQLIHMIKENETYRSVHLALIHSIVWDAILVTDLFNKYPSLQNMFDSVSVELIFSIKIWTKIGITMRPLAQIIKEMEGIKNAN